MSDIDTAAADSLKVLDPERPIREADIGMRWSPEGSVANDPSATPPGEFDTMRTQNLSPVS